MKLSLITEIVSIPTLVFGFQTASAATIDIGAFEQSPQPTSSPSPSPSAQPTL